MLSTQRNLTRFALTICLLAPASGYAQNPKQWSMRVTLGAPAEFEVDVRYYDPSDLFALVRDSSVMPFWVSSKNVSGRQASLTYDDFTLRLGNAGALVTVNTLDAKAAEEQLRRATRLGPLLKALTRQGGEWAANPMNAVFRGGSLSRDKTADGWVFFLRPPDLAFTGFMEFGTTRHPRELLATSSVGVSVAPTNTRAGSTLPEKVVKAINDAIALGQAIAQGQRPFGRSYAILFGVAEYDYRNDLTGPPRDLENLSKALTDQGFDKVVTVVNRDVTADTLRNIRQHFIEANALQPDDRLLVYYAGHGERDPSGDTGYIVLTASNPTARSPKTEVSMTEFMAWMKALPVKHLLVILDACYSGLAIGGRSRGNNPPLDAANRQELYELSARSGRFVMTAGDEAQLANEDKRWDGGLFTQGILRAIKTSDIGRPNDRLVTTFELFARAKQFVVEQVRQYRLKPQAPLLQDLGEAPLLGEKPSPVSRGEFVFVNVS